MEITKAVQDYYPAETAVCYGCGRNNPDGLHLKTYWDGQVGICRFTPKPQHTAFPGVVYGGLIASIIDCHCIGTAIAAIYDLEGKDMAAEPGVITCVTGNLNVTYLKPTPMDQELLLRATPVEVTERKAIITCSLFVDEIETAKGELVAVRVKARNAHDNHP